MKISFIYLVLCSLLLCASCKSKNRQAEQYQTSFSSADSTKTARMEVDKKLHDFGELHAGEIVSHKFTIKNTGTENLIIRNIESSCGCTTPKYDKKPIKPGKSAKIEVEFNTSGRFGKQYKVIHIFANIPEKSFEVMITANIK